MSSSTEIAKGFKRTNPGPLDTLYGPYDSLAHACRDVPNASKEVDGVTKNFRTGQVVGINTAQGIVEYWWPDPNASADTDLVVKEPKVDLSGLATVEELELKIASKEKVKSTPHN
jgi:hypothetical protein